MASWTEQEIEDHVCRNPYDVWDGNCVSVEVVSRQVALPSGGRLDVLLLVREAQGLRLVVVEVKRDRGTIAALPQLLGYMEEVRRLSDNLPVSGVLLARGHHRDVFRVARAIPSVRLAGYEAFISCWGVMYEDENGDRPGAMEGWFCDDEKYNPLRQMVYAARARLLRSRDRRLPVRLDDTPSRCYRLLP